MENQHRKITGYKDLDQEQIDLMNEFKAKEKELVALFKKAKAWVIKPKLQEGTIDEINAKNELATKLASESMRQLALFKTLTEQSMMHGIKSIAQPDSPWIE